MPVTSRISARLVTSPLPLLPLGEAARGEQERVQGGASSAQHRLYGRAGEAEAQHLGLEAGLLH